MTNEVIPQPQNHSTGAMWAFVLLFLPMPLCLLVYHFIVWNMEQSAIISLSIKQLAQSGLIGLAIQAVVMIAFTALLWRFTKDDRFKPIYADLFIASLVAIPALLLRLLGPNNDQPGSLLQFAIALIAALTVIWFRRKEITWNVEAFPFGLLIAGVGVLPFAIYGSFGSIGDALLSLLASLSFGLLAAVLMSPATGNRFFDGIGIGAVLALLGSALGYDGSQLILLAVLSPFAFAISAVMPSKAAAWAAVSLLTFAGLAVFDPTELTYVLGDIGTIALKACAIVIGVGLVTSVAALILSSKSGASPDVGWTGAGVVWVAVVAVFFLFGHPGNYGDRLFVIMKDQLDISDVAKIADRNERLTTAYQKLTAHANSTQADLRSVFDGVGIKYTPYYLENAMEVQGGTLVRLYLMTRPDVDRVLPSPHLRAVPDDLPQPGPLSQVEDKVQWNISMIGADKVWSEFNVRGKGIVIGQSDSGVDGSHPAIAKQYRGYNANDDYNWFDPWSGTTSPHDENGHGTHTTGTILGAGGIGVAPEAQWIACVNLDRNLANPAYYLNCMQFMLAPFPHGGNPFTDGNPTKAAYVLNNSWGCPDLEGCDPNSLLPAANNLRNAGIFVVVSTGNDGPNCETVADPLSLYDSVFSVGAIDSSGNMADFSSRGPVTIDGSGRVKPDIVAPGVQILSSTPNNTYAEFDGTSMAGPHLVGVVALIWSAQPRLIGDIDATEQLIIETAKPYSGTVGAGCFSGSNPSNAYGYGVVDVYAAVKKALER
jgi:subtilisin family serine protease